MPNIVWFQGKDHRQTQLVLPWYVTGRLDAVERAEVDDHLATCAACREELEAERSLAAQVANLAYNADAGWEKVRQRMQPRARPGRWSKRADALRSLLAWPGRMGWFLAGQALVAGLVLIVILPHSSPAEYHALAAPPAHAPGNLIVMFRPGTSEADLRAILSASRARIVDGPTVAGAYVLRVTTEDRNTILAELKVNKAILLAEPIAADSDR